MLAFAMGRLHAQLPPQLRVVAPKDSIHLETQGVSPLGLTTAEPDGVRSVLLDQKATYKGSKVFGMGFVMGPPFPGIRFFVMPYKWGASIELQFKPRFRALKSKRAAYWLNVDLLHYPHGDPDFKVHLYGYGGGTIAWQRDNFIIGFLSVGGGLAYAQEKMTLAVEAGPIIPLFAEIKPGVVPPIPFIGRMVILKWLS